MVESFKGKMLDATITKSVAHVRLWGCFDGVSYYDPEELEHDIRALKPLVFGKDLVIEGAMNVYAISKLCVQFVSIVGNIEIKALKTSSETFKVKGK